MKKRAILWDIKPRHKGRGIHGKIMLASGRGGEKNQRDNERDEGPDEQHAFARREELLVLIGFISLD
jgi:hypothetical protein